MMHCRKISTFVLLMHLHKPWIRMIFSCTFMFFIFHNAMSLPAAASFSNETDRRALLAFKGEITSDPSEMLRSWNDSLSLCHWPGVVCGLQRQRVTALALEELGLAGCLSPHLSNLSFIREIRLSGNKFHGQIPQDFGRLFQLELISLSGNLLEGAIPPSLSNCSQLAHILFTHNRLTGKFPLELAALSNLQTLSFETNELTGTIPQVVGNLTSLSYLSLGMNHFDGTIPSEIGKLSLLHTLQLSVNNLSGEVPPSLYNLSHIQVLRVGMNQLSGRLSPNIGYSFPNLVSIIVSFNEFVGTVPDSLSNASLLRELEVGVNHFSGLVPTYLGRLKHLTLVRIGVNEFGSDMGDDLNFITSLTNCSSLVKLDAGTNRLAGPLPESIANLSTRIAMLWLGRNRIRGKIPSGIENLINLEWLELNDNLLTGPVPIGIGRLQNMTLLSLNRNRLSGQLPPSLGNISRLMELDLSTNSLHGTIPSSLGNCSGLQVLSLSNNHLGGGLPKRLFKLTSVTTLNLSSNLFSGHLPLDVGELVNTNNLDVSHNKLIGSIPSTLGSCISLVDLNLSHNFFEGSIPRSLGSLKVVEKLDFSGNKLSGKIPKYFTELVYLRLLNLSYNNLEGQVPSGGIFNNDSAALIFGNKELCGGIPNLNLPPCQEDNDEKHSRRWPSIKVMIPVIVGILMILLICCLFAMKWRRRPRNAQHTDLPLNVQHLKITYRELVRITNGFSSANMVGSGSFGSVYKGLSDYYPIMVAVKVIDMEQTWALESFTAECHTLGRIRHRNIVKMLTSCSSSDYQGNEFKALVFEYMVNGSLESWLHSHGDDLYLSLDKRLDVAIDVAHALHYLHNECNPPIIHCDLKPSNVLFDEDMVAHVSDFGLAKFLLTASDRGDSSFTSLLQGSVGYTPPEYGIGYEANTRGDVYSYGILLLEMLTGKKPTDDMFTEGINISKYVKMSFQEHLTEIIDPRLLLTQEADANDRFKDCVISMINIGIACSAESPQDRVDIRVVCTKLHVVREIFHKGSRSLPFH